MNASESKRQPSTAMLWLASLVWAALLISVVVAVVQSRAPSFTPNGWWFLGTIGVMVVCAMLLGIVGCKRLLFGPGRLSAIAALVIGFAPLSVWPLLVAEYQWRREVRSQPPRGWQFSPVDSMLGHALDATSIFRLSQKSVDVPLVNYRFGGEATSEIETTEAVEGVVETMLNDSEMVSAEYDQGSEEQPNEKDDGLLQFAKSFQTREDLAAADFWLARIEDTTPRRFYASWLPNGRTVVANTVVPNTGSPNAAAVPADSENAKLQTAKAFLNSQLNPNAAPPSIFVDGWSQVMLGVTDEDRSIATSTFGPESTPRLGSFFTRMNYWKSSDVSRAVGGVLVEDLVDQFGESKFLELTNAVSSSDFLKQFERVVETSWDEYEAGFMQRLGIESPTQNVESNPPGLQEAVEILIGIDCPDELIETWETFSDTLAMRYAVRHEVPAALAFQTSQTLDGATTPVRIERVLIQPELAGYTETGVQTSAAEFVSEKRAFSVSRVASDAVREGCRIDDPTAKQQMRELVEQKVIELQLRGDPLATIRSLPVVNLALETFEVVSGSNSQESVTLRFVATDTSSEDPLDQETSISMQIDRSTLRVTAVTLSLNSGVSKIRYRYAEPIQSDSVADTSMVAEDVGSEAVATIVNDPLAVVVETVFEGTTQQTVSETSTIKVLEETQVRSLLDEFSGIQPASCIESEKVPQWLSIFRLVSLCWWAIAGLIAVTLALFRL